MIEVGAAASRGTNARLTTRPRRRNRSPFGPRHGIAAPAYAWVWFLPWMLPFLIFAVGAALAIFVYSLTDLNGLPGVPTHWIGLHNYREFFGAAQFAGSRAVLIRTVIFCLAVTVVQNSLALALAVILNGRIRGSRIWRALIFMPTILGVAVIGLMWSLILDPNNGPVAGLLRPLGVHTALLGDSNIAFELVIAIMIWGCVGYAMVIYLGGLQAIPGELHEAAVVDGASRWRTFRHVTFPLLSTALTANVLLSLIGSLQAYQYIYVLTSGKFDTSVLATEVVQFGFFNESTNEGYAAALSIVQFLLILVVVALVYVPLRLRERRLVN